MAAAAGRGLPLHPGGGTPPESQNDTMDGLDANAVFEPRVHCAPDKNSKRADTVPGYLNHSTGL